MLPLLKKVLVSTSKLSRQALFAGIDLQKINSMATVVKTSVTINRPAEQVWLAFMNTENLPYWLSGFVSVTPISGERGAVGSKSTIVLNERGKEMIITETLLELTPSRQFRCAMESKQMNSECDFRFVSFGHTTELIQTVQLHPKGLMMKFLLPFLKGSVVKTMTNDLIWLKKFIEEHN